MSRKCYWFKMEKNSWLAWRNCLIALLESLSSTHWKTLMFSRLWCDSKQKVRWTFPLIQLTWAFPLPMTLMDTFKKKKKIYFTKLLYNLIIFSYAMRSLPPSLYFKARDIYSWSFGDYSCRSEVTSLWILLCFSLFILVPFLFALSLRATTVH